MCLHTVHVCQGEDGGCVCVYILCMCVKERMVCVSTYCACVSRRGWGVCVCLHTVHVCQIACCAVDPADVPFTFDTHAAMEKKLKLTGH